MEENDVLQMRSPWWGKTWRSLGIFFVEFNGLRYRSCSQLIRDFFQTKMTTQCFKDGKKLKKPFFFKSSKYLKALSESFK